MKHIPLSFDADGEYGYIEGLVDKTPDYMLVREFTQNGIEAPGEGPRTIEWGCEGKKLTVWNDGEALTHEEMEKLRLMSSVGRKAKGKHGNKGIGARITGMSMSPAGLIYDTYNGEKVERITLSKQDGQYGGSEIEDVTDEWGDLGDDRHWTTVMFKGGYEAQDTTQKFWQGAPKHDMVGRALWDRYFRIPEHVTVKVSPHLPSSSHRVSAEMVLISDHFAQRAAHHDMVEMTNGVIVHYYHLPDWYTADGAGKHVRHAGRQKLSSGVVFCSDDSCQTAEIFSHIYGKKQTSTFMAFGMESVAEEVAVFVEVPKAMPVSMSDYRETLNWDEVNSSRKVNRHRQIVKLQDFAAEIRAGAPDWLVQLIKDKKQKRNENRLERRLKEVAKRLRELGVYTEAPKRDKDGEENAAEEDKVKQIDNENPENEDPNPEPNPRPRPGLRGGSSIRSTIKRLLKVGIPTTIESDINVVNELYLTNFPIQIIGQNLNDPDIRVVVDGHNRFINAAREKLREQHGYDAVELFEFKLQSELEASFAFEWALVAGQALEGSWGSFERYEEGDEDPIIDVTTKAASAFMLNSMVDGIDAVVEEVKLEILAADAA